MPKPNLKHLSNLLLNTPLMVLPSKLYAILSAIGERIGVEGFEMINSGFVATEKNKPQKSTANIAVIPVHGVLTNRSMKMKADSTDFRSYEAIRSEFNTALEDDTVSAIAFDIESPGGEASGLMDLSDDIYNARGKKPIYSIVNDYAFSAAYGIASAADEIFVSRSGSVGSVGVISQHMDMSKSDEQEGLKFTPIFAGARKNDFSPHAPLTTEAKKIVQRSVDDAYDLFTATVARNLGVDQQDIKDTEAGLFSGNKAIKAGLAHHLMSPKEALTMISEKPENISTNKTITSKKERRVISMNLDELKTKHPELVQTIEKDAIVSALAEQATQNTIDTDKAVSTALEAQSEKFGKEKAELNQTLLKLEKNDAIRTEKEIKATADSTWTKALNNSEIPTHMHGKVKQMVGHSQFVTENVLDCASFETAIAAEIKDWESKGITQANTVVNGIGSVVADATGEPTTKAEAETEENETVHRMLLKAGDKIGAAKFAEEVGITLQ